MEIVEQGVKQISHLALVFLLLTLSKQMPAALMTSKIFINKTYREAAVVSLSSKVADL